MFAKREHWSYLREGIKNKGQTNREEETKSTRKSSCGKPHEAYHPQYISCPGGYPSPGQRGVPQSLSLGVPQSWPGGTPVLAWGGGYPSPHWVRRVGPIWDWDWGNPPFSTGTGYPPNQKWGTPRKGPETRDQGKNLGLVYPQPPVVNRLKTLPSPSFG